MTAYKEFTIKVRRVRNVNDFDDTFDYIVLRTDGDGSVYYTSDINDFVSPQEAIEDAKEAIDGFESEPEMI